MPKDYISTVLLDPGHGGNDSGAVNVALNLRECDLNLEIGLQVRDALASISIPVFMTREKDKSVSLADRVRMIEPVGAGVFVSIHCNSREKVGAMGLEPETFYSTLNDKEGWSDTFARFVHAWYVKTVEPAIKIKNRGVKTANYFVLRASTVPATLIELGFLCDTEEANFLKDKTSQQLITKGLFIGISHFVDLLRYS